MTPDHLAAIRERDAEADGCLVCGMPRRAAVHQMTAEQCAAKFGACRGPDQHHPCQPGGMSSLAGYGDEDRRALLAYVDELRDWAPQR